MNSTYDAGKDGRAGYLVSNPNEHKNTAIDIASYTLGYFGGDYKAINTASQFEASYSGFGFDLAANNLYNGNIRSLVTSINGMNSLGTAYRYDQLQRLKSMTAFDWNTSPAVNSWLNVAATTNYFNSYTYDKNGNILNLQRNGVASPMDNFTYNYTTVSGQPSNRLGYVGDVVSAGNYTDDIDNQSTGNYGYDRLGQLTMDVSEQITNIEWRSGDKKIKKLSHSAGSGKPNLEFIYNPFGQRIIKIVKLNPGTTEDWKYTYYTYDANGQVMAMYDVDLSTALKKATLSEHHLYGASRLGMRKADRVLYNNGVVNYPTLDVQQHKAGIINYEITNYLGNVNVVITDRKTWNATGAYFEAVSLMKCDYYPFGMEMQGRKITTSNYRYGYNGMEKDDEAKGEGNSYTTEFRQYDPRLGRWLSLDPLMAQFPWMSPYVAFDNNPIAYKDPLGLAVEGGPGKKQAKAEAEEAISIYTEGADIKGKIRYSINKDNSVTYRYRTNGGNRVKKTIFNAINSVGAIASRPEHDYSNTNIIYQNDLSSQQRTDVFQYAFGPPECTIEFPMESSYLRGYGVKTMGSSPSGLRSGNLLQEFLYGTGPEYSIFPSDHPLTLAIRKNIEEIDRLKSIIYERYGGDIGNLKKEAMRRYGAIYTGFMAYNGTFLPNDEDLSSIGQFIGTFSADVYYDATTKRVTFVIIDSKSRSSLNYHMTGDTPREQGERTPKGNTYQKYIWSEPVENLLNWK